jgi:hypothetical protein
MDKRKMKEVEIDGKTLIIYEDGSIRIPHKDMPLCLDFVDISFLYRESRIAIEQRASNRKKAGQVGC